MRNEKQVHSSIKETGDSHLLQRQAHDIKLWCRGAASLQQEEELVVYEAFVINII